MNLVKTFIQCSAVLGICLLGACSNSEPQKTATSSETTVKADGANIKADGENLDIKVNHGSDGNKIDVQVNDKNIKVDTPLVKVNVDDEQNQQDNDKDNDEEKDNDNDEPNENTQVAIGNQGIKVNSNEANVKIGADELKIDTGDVSIDLNGKDGLKINTK